MSAANHTCLLSCRDSELKTFDLTGKTGSFMYMAPEVYDSEAYNEKADVFSFACIMSELYSRYILSTQIVGPTGNPDAAMAYAEKVSIPALVVPPVLFLRVKIYALHIVEFSGNRLQAWCVGGRGAPPPPPSAHSQVHEALGFELGRGGGPMMSACKDRICFQSWLCEWP